MRRQRLLASALCVAAATAAVGCGADRGGAGGRAGTASVRYPEVAAMYQASVALRLREGRQVTEDLVAGRLAAVYAASSAETRAAVSLAEVDGLFNELRSQARIGSLVEERAMPLGPDRGLYWADYRWGDGRLRFTVAFTTAGLVPLVEPVTPSPVDPRAGAPARAALRLPFEGLWWVSEGPTPEIGAHHLHATDQRHAYDFAIWRDGATYRHGGADNDDYWCWGQPVIAPAGGRVTAVQDGVTDNRPWVETNAAVAAGNHVVIDLGHGEYAAIAHLQNGSVRVAQGDQVRAGDVLGLCGNSGNSSEPHVHFHVQDKPSFFADGAVGIPVQFQSLEVDGGRRAGGAPASGQFVAHAGIEEGK